MADKRALIALSTFVPFGPVRIGLLVSYFGSPRKAWEASESSLLEIGLSKKLVAGFAVHRAGFDITDYFSRLRKQNIKIMTIGSSEYPVNLKEIETAPVVLYVKGNLKAFTINSVAIVGSRKMTSYGKEVTERFAGELASLGVAIVSGLARGVDTIAHQSTLAVGGKTLAVLGCGPDLVYPLENTGLAKRIIENDGAVISEYPLSYPALRVNFANRNRIISGLSKAVVVVEGQEKSGTLLTASHAANQGRQVFAVPGQITSPQSGAPHLLIKSGAKPATSVNDILEELDLQLKVDKEQMEKAMPNSNEEEKLMQILENEPLHLDEIARISSLEVSDISARLAIMELKGLVKNTGRGVYRKI
jgi:DNA processing protein